MWLKIHDGMPFDPKVMLLGKTKAQVNEAIGMATRLWAWCAQQRTDGFLPAAVVEAVGTPACVKRLTTPVFERKPFLHRVGAQCTCLGDRRWPADAAYLVHDYLRYNPSRDENDVDKAQRRELRDRELRAAIRRRDADRCRYCGIDVSWQDHRSARGGVLDHVVPNLAAGPDNLVVACRGCNTRKGKRTPEAAGMRLLPLPDQPAGPTTRTPETHDGPKTDPRSNHGSDPKPYSKRTRVGSVDPAVGPSPPEPPPSRPNTPSVRPQTALDGTQNGNRARTHYTGTDAPGRDGTGSPWAVGPPLTQRAPHDPSPYLRAAITGPSPDEHAGHLAGED
ncbi:MAG TPA: HNH endonuclease [Nocardioides sp.]